MFSHIASIFTEKGNFTAAPNRLVFKLGFYDPRKFAIKMRANSVRFQLLDNWSKFDAKRTKRVLQGDE
jgi:hypothetical protein